MKKSHLVVFVITVLIILTLIVTYTPSVRKNMKLEPDLQGGFEVLYEMSPLEGKKLPSMTAVARSAKRRIDVLGVNKPEITVESGNRIHVQLAGAKNTDQVRRIISSTTNPTFRGVSDNLLMNSTVLQEDGTNVVYGNHGRSIVSLELSDQKKFYEVTQKISQMGSGSSLMVAWPDFNPGTDPYTKKKDQKNPESISAAAASEGINSTSAQISGSLTKEKVIKLKDLINSGSLPVKMGGKHSDATTTDYGINAFSETMLAGGTSIALIVLFMILYYRLLGLISAVMLTTYVLIVFLTYNAMGIAFTLSGTAAPMFGVGMTTDSNIPTPERIKDVLCSRRSVKTTFYEGSSKFFITVFDARAITFIYALILCMMGMGSAKGFAAVLAASTISTTILIIFVTKFLLSLLVDNSWLNDRLSWFGMKKAHVPGVSKGQERLYFGSFKNSDFVKNAKYFIVASITVLVIGVRCMALQGMKGNGILNWSIDFTNRTKLMIQSDTAIFGDKLNGQPKSLGISADSIKINGEKDNVANIFVKDAIDKHKMDTVKTGLKKTHQHGVNDSVVTPVIGQEPMRSATLISILTWIGVLIYVSIHSKWDCVISGIVGLIHDTLFMLAVCAIFRLEISTEITAVLLAMIGYPIDNSIVVFDRICDGMKRRRLAITTKAEYHEVVNEALQKTATESILSTLTTILPIVCLLLFGGSATHIFCLVPFIGIVCSAGSSLLVATQLWYQIRIHQNPRKHAKEKHKEKKDELEGMIIPGIGDY